MFYAGPIGAAAMTAGRENQETGKTLETFRAVHETQPDFFI
jgi:hypothetical protein